MLEFIILNVELFELGIPIVQRHPPQQKQASNLCPVASNTQGHRGNVTRQQLLSVRAHRESIQNSRQHIADPYLEFCRPHPAQATSGSSG